MPSQYHQPTWCSYECHVGWYPSITIIRERNKEDKKMLMAGERGHKDKQTDLDEAIQSIQRAKELV
jgi:hypothetical protein